VVDFKLTWRREEKIKSSQIHLSNSVQDGRFVFSVQKDWHDKLPKNSPEICTSTRDHILSFSHFEALILSFRTEYANRKERLLQGERS